MCGCVWCGTCDARYDHTRLAGRVRVCGTGAVGRASCFVAGRDFRESTCVLYCVRVCGHVRHFGSDEPVCGELCVQSQAAVRGGAARGGGGKREDHSSSQRRP